MSIPDGDQNFYDAAPESVFCEKCQGIVDDAYFPNFLPLSKRARSLDIFTTYDGKTIVSERGAVFFKKMFRESCDLHLIKSDMPIYLMKPLLVADFDSVRRGTRFSDICVKCHKYVEVVGATPCFLRQSEPLNHGLYRTNVEFGTSRRRNPLILVGADDLLIMKKFKPYGGGLVLKPITS